MRHESVLDILMRRDGLTKEEAMSLIEETRSELYDAISGTSCLDPEEVMASNLGLEPDYIFDIL